MLGDLVSAVADVLLVVIGAVAVLLAALVVSALEASWREFRSSAPAREAASAPSVSRALTELGAELDLIAWEWAR